MKRCSIFVITLIAAISAVKTTEGQLSGGLAAGLRIAYGFVIPHHRDMAPYTGRHFPAFELETSWPVKGNEPWKILYHYPEYGISYLYSGLGNSSILGDVHALCPWMRVPMYSGRALSIGFRFGLGAGYFQKKFNRISNHKNLAIGSHINLNMQFMIDARIMAANRHALSLGLGIQHFSNGTFITPNYGINFPGISLSYAFRPSRAANLPMAEIPDTPKHHEMDLEVTYGRKELLPVTGPKYDVAAFMASWHLLARHKRNIGIGLDLFWDASEKELLRREGDSSVKEADLLKPGIHALHEWNFGRLKVDLKLGVYLYEREKSDGPVYDQLGLRYFVTSSSFIGFFLKSHYARADFIGISVGHRLSFKNKGG